MRVTVQNGSGHTDVELSHLTRASIGQVASACGLDAGAVDVDGVLYPPETPLPSIPMAAGSILSQGSRPLPEAAAPAAALRHVAGWAASSSINLDAGDYGLGLRNESGLSFDSVADPDVFLRVTADGARFKGGATQDVTVDADPADRVANARNALAVAAGSGLQVTNANEDRPTAGPLLWNRPPRTAPPPADNVIEVPARPAVPRGREALSWIMMLMPLPIGIVMAFLWSPIFALFILMSPLMLLGQWVEGRSRAKKDRRRFGKEFAESLDAVRTQAAEKSDHERARVRRTQPTIAELRQWALVGGRRVWERRRTHEDYLILSAGFADQHLNLLLGGPGASNFPEAAEAVAETTNATNVPALIHLAKHGSVGIVGSRPMTLAIARSLALQAATLHGPADVEFALCSPAANLTEWEWLKWLPHIRGGPSGTRVITEVAQVDEHLDQHDDEPDEAAPHRLFIVDHTELLGAAGSPLRGALAETKGTYGIIVADRPEQLPASCGAIIDIDRSGSLHARFPQAGTGIRDILPAGVDDADATTWARSLARFHDPESAGASSGITDGVTLVDLLGRPDGSRIAADWAQLGADPTPKGVVGSSAAGPLTIDLAHDGPHGLVAGTTGSGKSELLRTMVASMATAVDPDHLNFVLIDFKGGGAFDVCADLPHVVSVVTDLDEHLAERALRCLKAELRLREELLRAAGATDLGEYLEGGGSRLPRLVVIVDEFATLAVELPDFLDSLVDIAQRGRSLGVHLILATQRPSGVLDAKVRANTNLRIALRVQDDGDSDDVIGTTQAARLPRNKPGRAFARFGQSDIVEFQTALVTGPYVEVAERAVSIRGFDLLTPDSPSVAALSSAEGATTGVDEIALFVHAINEAFTQGGYEKPRMPWPDPLPTAVDAEQLNDQVPLGIVDLPDRQQQRVVNWTTANGNMLLYAIDTDDIRHTMSTIVLGLARTTTPTDFHFYGIEYGTNLLSPLTRLSHCGDVIDGADRERTLRLIGMLSAEVAERREQRTADPSLDATAFPLTLLLIDNYAGLTEQLEEAGEFDALSHVAQLLRDGPAVGLYSIVGAQHERGVPIRVANQIEYKLLFRLVDTSAYSTFGLRPSDVPHLGPRRCIDPAIGEQIQVAWYGGGDIDRAVEQVLINERLINERQATSAGPVRVRVLEQHYRFEDLDLTHVSQAVDEWQLPIAVDAASLQTAHLVLGASEHGLVLGRAGSGKSSTLQTIAAAARLADPTLPIIAVTHRRSPLATCPHITTLTTARTPVATLEALVDTPRVLVLIDDADSLAPDYAAMLERLAAIPVDERHMIAACRADFPKAFDAWVQPLRNNQSGVILQPSPHDGEGMRTMLPLHRPERFPVGRGFIVVNGVADMAQLSLPPEVDPIQHSEILGDTVAAPENPASSPGSWESAPRTINLGLNGPD